jgi:hypothetical protein
MIIMTKYYKRNYITHQEEAAQARSGRAENQAGQGLGLSIF